MTDFRLAWKSSTDDTLRYFSIGWKNACIVLYVYASIPNGTLHHEDQTTLLHTLDVHYMHFRASLNFMYLRARSWMSKQTNCHRVRKPSRSSKPYSASSYPSMFKNRLRNKLVGVYGSRGLPRVQMQQRTVRNLFR